MTQGYTSNPMSECDTSRTIVQGTLIFNNLFKVYSILYNPMEFLRKIFGQKLLNALAFFIIGLALYFSDDVIQAKHLGIGVTLISLLFLINEIKLRYYIKRKRKDEKIDSKEESFIADYLKDKKINYVYKKKIKLSGKKIETTFFLPEFDIYLIYWAKNYDQKNRKEIEKRFNDTDTHLVQIYYDNIKIN